ncbi:FliM/FliN family flagellar motor switch protein [Neobacillus sp. 19]|uniref:FliM/FliN family flagellar motor switch protein n=1 Tax=Neobacillus sp. 19 TaxID=3394458 RepID=UPI003BF6C37B
MKDGRTEAYGAVQSVQFSPIIEQPTIAQEKRQLTLLTDVSVQVSFELGRTKKTVREILELKKGSVLSLDKLAGQNVDMLVNSMPMATGELVVIEEQLSVKVAEIVSKQQREKNLK